MGDLTNVLLNKAALFRVSPPHLDVVLEQYAEDPGLASAFDRLVDLLASPARKGFPSEIFWQNSFVRYIVDTMEPNDFPESAIDLMSGPASRLRLCACLYIPIHVPLWTAGCRGPPACPLHVFLP